MEYLVSATTDIGNTKKTNQDSINVKTMTINGEKVVLAVLCDGMGGLEKGEVASATVIKSFHNWVVNVFPYMYARGFTESDIRSEWTKLIVENNEKIKLYGKKSAISLGTTITAILLAKGKYYCVNVGDSRTYEIYDSVVTITKDQTVVARDVELGVITPEQAAVDPRRSVLLQCIGASENVYPDFFFGDEKQNAVYMLCSDGFRHEITPEEIYAAFRPDNMTSAEQMKNNEIALIDLNKRRMEKDNISVITIRTY